jgi:hypothetical protein
MSRFDGYNRNDFHYARTTREAFGDNFYVEKKPQTVKEFLIWLVCVVALVCLSLVLQGMI